MKSDVSVNRSGNRAVFMMTRCGVLAAMAIILFYIEIPVVAFYKLDLSSLPALLAGFAMGPLPGFMIVVIKNLAHMLGSSTAMVGEFADILMSGTFVVVASLMYRYNKNLKGAVLSMVIATLAMMVAGVLVNYFILIPAYQKLFHMDVAAILGMVGIKGVDSLLKLVLMVTAPFNLLKGGVISVITFLLYKRISPLLHQ
ncbi:MAG: ECF transporter S component [Clostridia bacterium]|nr:ECF transporter S component [Clostridia bacterium]